MIDHPTYKISDLCDQIRGVTYSKSDATHSPTKGYLPVLRANNITEAGLIFNDLVYVPEGNIAAKQKLKANDILIATSSGSIDVVGKAARVTSNFHGGFGAFCRVLRPNTKVDPSYFSHYFKTKDYRRRISALAAGANINNLRNEHLNDLEIALPPLPEQRRIAAILDKADALRAKRREAIAKLDQLLQSVFLEMFGEPASNPKGFKLARLEDLGEWKSGGTPSRRDPAYFDGDIPWYSSGELNDVYVESSAEQISIKALRESSAKLMAPGTLMIGMYDTAAFKSSITTMPSACNQAIAFSLLDPDKAETLYVYHALQTGKEHYKRLQRGVRQKNLNLTMVKQTQIPLPSLEQQRCFVRISQRITQQKQALLTHSSQHNRLFTSLQHCAYAGEL